ncbi:helix-turn-helix domain-containing protein [Aeromonas molluscorum]|uniref:helix-turn-helix domain-containing protein n=1 Tax=Aeromonas molluscorum TaxID=271417 RepID=UPI003F195A87
MDISDVVKRAGIPASTLRFYEERGLIHSVGRQGIRRQFHEGVLERLALIALGQTAGFSLDEIGQMLGENRWLEIDRARLSAKAQELDDTIQKLAAMRDGLRHAAICSAPSHMACPTFRRLLARAAAGARGASKKKRV